MQNEHSMNFDYQIVDEVVVIYDLHKGDKSVTHNIKNVLAQIKLELPDLGSHKIIYSDSMRVFDGINVDENGEFTGYYSFNELKLQDALAKIKTETVDTFPAV